MKILVIWNENLFLKNRLVFVTQEFLELPWFKNIAE